MAGLDSGDNQHLELRALVEHSEAALPAYNIAPSPAKRQKAGLLKKGYTWAGHSNLDQDAEESGEDKLDSSETAKPDVANDDADDADDEDDDDANADRAVGETQAFWRAFSDASRVGWRQRKNAVFTEANGGELKEENLPSVHRWLLHLTGDPSAILDRCLALDILLGFPDRTITKADSDMLAAQLSGICRHFMTIITLARLLAEGKHVGREKGNDGTAWKELRCELNEAIGAQEKAFAETGLWMPGGSLQKKQNLEIPAAEPMPQPAPKPSYYVQERYNHIQREKAKALEKERKQKAQAQLKGYQRAKSKTKQKGEHSEISELQEQLAPAHLKSLHSLLTDPTSANAQDVTALEPLHSLLSESAVASSKIRNVPAEFQSNDLFMAEFRSKKNTRPRVRRVAHPSGIGEDSTSLPRPQWHPPPPVERKVGPARPRVLYRMPYQVSSVGEHLKHQAAWQREHNPASNRDFITPALQQHA